MAGNEYHAVRPKTSLAGSDIPYDARILAGSSLAVQGIFLEALREYFLGYPAHAPYRWDTDANITEILIELGQNPNVEVRNPSRALYLTRLSSIPRQIAIGDRMGVHLPTGQESYMAHITCALQVDCVSASRGECELLGDFVHGFLLAGKRVFEASYGLREMSLPTLGPVGPYQADTEMYAVSISFTIEYAIRWTAVRIAPKLNELHLHVMARMGMRPQPGAPGDAEAAAAENAFIEAAFNSLSRAVPAIPDKIPVPPPDRT